jgi:hypothetical protein
MTFEVTVDAQEALQTLDRLEMTQAVAPAFQRGFFRMLDKITDYPPAPAGSTYRRTGTYGRTCWVDDSRASDLIWYTRNPTDYAASLADPEQQTDQHRETGWKTTQQVAETVVDDIVDEVNEALRQLAN